VIVNLEKIIVNFAEDFFYGWVSLTLVNFVVLTVFFFSNIENVYEYIVSGAVDFF
jgi:hypothetical protein